MLTTRSIRAAFQCALVVFALPVAAAAQQPPEFDSLRTPSTPAFNVLDIEPSAVERPATPSDAAVSIINNFREGAVPKNFAFESSPYWLVSQPRVTWRGDSHRSVGQSLARTTSISLATAETGTDAKPVSSLAFGFRTLIFSGQLSPETVKAYENLETLLASDGAAFLNIARTRGLTALETQLTVCLLSQTTEGGKNQCANDYEARKKALMDEVLDSDEFKKASAPLTGAESIVPKREGFYLEVAGAFAWDFANADWKAHEFRKRQIWVTPSYSSAGWAGLGVLRYEDAPEGSDDSVDWGFRGMYSADKYAVSLEWVERSPIDSATLERSHRVIGIGEYKVTPGTWIVASFGKDRQKTPSTPETLVAQLGLSFNFSKERYKFPSATP